jgi:AraC-like DNA-binding protein
MARPRTEKARGILNVKAGQAEPGFHHARLLPSDDLSFFVEHYWIVAWDLTGQEPQTAETLPYPSIHLVIERDRSRLYGVTSGKFVRRIEGKGRAFGIKFRPGAFYPFVKSSISAFTDKVIPLSEIFGADALALERTIVPLDDADKDQMIEAAEAFLRARLPEQDDNVRLVNDIVSCITADREITKVDTVVSRLGVGKRQMQRLFSLYVGVSPKWVIKRYRMHEAVERLAEGGAVDWPQLALDLGYFDQAHFIKEFKSMVGRSPLEYTKSLNAPSE